VEQRSWARQLRDAATAAGTVAEIAEGAVLPPHHATCLGCGPKALAGYHLRAVRRGDEVVAEFTFQPEHSGGPGLAHGGAVATVCDDLLGHVFFLLVGAPGVTRRLEVDYLAPVVLGARQQLTARLVERDGRKLWVECEGAHDGTVHFRARALMIHVDLRHFLAGLSPEQRTRAEAYLAEHGGSGDANAP
jgi:acyl-coenzyme A thioesterase PaaI-like protein